ncbi:unnamed protein product [Spirodela intermedia]|uniref:Uncharacterized protein n=2 Tax=Spirodela intermedia TaxID=51605 RepID=A0A7I8KWX2_SPIIN|nr:unnamed protein product [Spirodela intermedia]CAA6665579.1 unnamed protein product [Spirodela intermedia]CAA7402313.1 unnamed protein product [Spirodela intermedia]
MAQQQQALQPSSQVLAVATLFPVGGVLLVLSGLTLTATVIALAAATPLLVIFSPVLVPAALVVALAVAGFLASGAFGLTALSSLSYISGYLRGDAPGSAHAAACHLGQGIKERVQQATGRA